MISSTTPSDLSYERKPEATLHKPLKCSSNTSNQMQWPELREIETQKLSQSTILNRLNSLENLANYLKEEVPSKKHGIEPLKKDLITKKELFIYGSRNIFDAPIDERDVDHSKRDLIGFLFTLSMKELFTLSSQIPKTPCSSEIKRMFRTAIRKKIATIDYEKQTEDRLDLIEHLHHMISNNKAKRAIEFVNQIKSPKERAHFLQDIAVQLLFQHRIREALAVALLIENTLEQSNVLRYIVAQQIDCKDYFAAQQIIPFIKTNHIQEDCLRLLSLSTQYSNFYKN
jgi:hypothetical protein